MIEGISNHRLSDFVPFSRDVLYAAFEAYNADIWPAQIVWIAVALLLIPIIRHASKHRARLVFAIISGAWILVGLVFHLDHFRQLTWAAAYFAGLFLTEGALLFAFGTVANTLQFDTKPKGVIVAGMSLFVISVCVPFEMLLGQTLRQTLQFGWGPDHTALGTIGVLLMANGRGRVWLLIPPVTWCITAVLIHIGAR